MWIRMEMNQENDKGQLWGSPGRFLKRGCVAMFGCPACGPETDIMVGPMPD